MIPVLDIAIVGDSGKAAGPRDGRLP